MRKFIPPSQLLGMGKVCPTNRALLQLIIGALNFQKQRHFLDARYRDTRYGNDWHSYPGQGRNVANAPC